MLDLFAGHGGVSRAVRLKGGRALEYEIEKGNQFDLTNKDVLSDVLLSISSGKVSAVMMATPCVSFTTARDRNSQIRTSRRPWGLPNLPEKLQQTLTVGNACARSTIAVLETCERHHVKCILENPSRSRLFLLGPIRRLLRQHPESVTFVVGDFCQFGARWRKSTGFLCVHIPPADLEKLARRCQPLQGCCNRTKRPHIVLSGTSPEGIPWTNIAQPYPRALCKTLCEIFMP